MNGHTQEPWKADGGYISGADGLCVANTIANPEDAAARIVACVNACAGNSLFGTIGYSDEELLTAAKIGGLRSICDAVSSERDLFKQERDELLIIVKEVLRVGRLSAAGHEIAMSIVAQAEAR